MIFLLEDEASIAEPIRVRLERLGHEVRWFRSRAAAEQTVLESVPKLVLIDVHLTDGDEAGFEFLKTLRESGFSMPVLMLTARDSIADRILGLDLGADDYLPKPFDLSELAARIRALLRRDSQNKEHTLIRGQLEIDFASKRVLWQGQEVNLTQREYTLLELFARNPDRSFSNQDLIDRVWHQEAENSNVVRVYIHYLRNKLSSDIIKKNSNGYQLGV